MQQPQATHLIRGFVKMSIREVAVYKFVVSALIISIGVIAEVGSADTALAKSRTLKLPAPLKVRPRPAPGGYIVPNNLNGGFQGEVRIRRGTSIGFSSSGRSEVHMQLHQSIE